ncbi:TPA: DUF4236 domain-containing protein [Yersinia enterocolitica]|uniref:DUF4236 domain-containing protein n=1 Tax=Yersinia mollaretii TaxID=33060 RepID=UPI00061C498A|nr:DUF4236 domain-containing protein [Yersinia mollaretii]EKN3337230.1 DUF4236 domain-containing protein [Yersinia enterocolitica]EKN5088541.1 DUF4236 domain-containing protein [Yersinia enterocolitica]ELW8170961.1 DUF4236 domain-containing protein [Yersinia enterocolitica]ELY5259712.1 DUF4236 domain-containing protein [Yersinia enterocolitica]EME3603709.1 DUF4236 domain-containing protein [Yersinia enterocolitica]
MGFRFRRRIKIAPGININIGKNGVTSATIGKRGASVNIGKAGTKATAGIPGTGMSWTETLSKSANPNTTPQVDKNVFKGLVISSSEFKSASAQIRKSWRKGGGKVSYSKNQMLISLLAWFVAALASFILLLPGLSIILVIVGTIRCFWKQPEVNFSIQEYIDHMTTEG